MPHKPAAEPDAGPTRRDRLHDHVEELTGLLESWLSEARQRATTLRDIAAEVRNEPILSSLPGEMERRTLGQLEDLATRLERATDQVGLLTSLLDAAAAAAPRVAVFALKGNRLVGWSGRGFAAGIKPRNISFPLEDDNLMCQAARQCAPAQERVSQRPGNDGLATQLGGPAPETMLAVPLWVRDRVVAVLYADAPSGATPWVPEGLQVMASLAALSLEALPARQKFPRPPGQGKEGSAAAAPRPAEPAGQTGSTPSITSVSETGAHPAIIIPPAAAVAATPPPAAAEPSASSAAESSASSAAESSASSAAEASASSAADSSASSAAEGMVSAAAEAATQVEASSRSEASTAASPADGEMTHLRAEALRFARLLVSEIVLYNGAQIEEGRRQKDLYQRLREDIERSREMYQQRVSPRLSGEPDLFRQELVAQLAQGDETALITPWG